MSLSKSFFLASLVLFQVKAKAQHDSLVHHFLKRIEAEQKKPDDFFIDEIFPSYISSHETFNTKKKDNNIFYNGLIIYTLEKAKVHIVGNDRRLVEKIIADARQPFPKFKNKRRNTYNFWRTDSAYAFPYTWWIRLLNQNAAPPDDMDDSVFGEFAMDEGHEYSKQLHFLMQRYVNIDTINFKSVEKKYKHIRFYSTWFGKNFPVVLDVSVLCNILSFVQEDNLKWTKSDSASLQLIRTAIDNNDIVDRPLSVSPYYGKTSIILYHLARLMSVKPIAELENVKPKLKELALQEFYKTHHSLEKIMLASALYKWGYPAPEFKLPSTHHLEKEIEHNNFPFFIGNIPSYFAAGKREFLTKNKIGLFFHYCPAFNDALLIEYLTLKVTSPYAR